MSDSGGPGPGPPPGPEHADLQDLPAVLADRRAKLRRLRAAGVEPYPYAYRNPDTGQPPAPIAEIRARHAGLEPGAETPDRYHVAGRLSARRDQGRAAFLDLVDRSGRIQLFATAAQLGDERLAALLALDLGDLVGVQGTIFVTRRGELSLRVEDFTLLAKSLRPPPDKRHGLSDVETRFRQRELDLLSNEEARRLFIDRAKVIRAVRSYLDEAGFIEVETPVLQPLYGGALARPFTTHHNALDRTLYLRIATELYLKRLLVGGLERVYELGKDFRNEGLSTKHNPEFTMVEWYEAYADYSVEMDRLEEVVRAAAAAIGYAGPHDFGSRWPRMTLQETIREHAGVDILEHRDRDSLASAIERAGCELPVAERTWPALVDDLLSTYVEPRLQQPTFLCDYPIELSPFARAHRSVPGLAERWEAFVGGIEIANAFSELNDPDEQRARFDAQRRLAREGDEEAQPFDEAFIRALENGMPPAGGVGVGIDRLVMVLTGRSSIREVVLFPALR